MNNVIENGYSNVQQDFMTIRPAGRHLTTIGSDLIKDDYTAIIELVKNSYDADAENVYISIKGMKDSISISIKDDGHGMDYDTIANQWLVPSTNNKLQRKESPKKRVMQGRKGIGRYAAIVLGNDMLLDTQVSTGEHTTIAIDWSKFEDAQYLSDVEVLLDKKNENNNNHYTEIKILGGKKLLESWKEKGSKHELAKISKLAFELKKLISPFYKDVKEDNFNIYLEYEGLFDDLLDKPEKIKIDKLPILDLYDYRISGDIKNKIVNLVYENKKNPQLENLVINKLKDFDINSLNIGNVKFDLKVYDRETDDIRMLLERGNRIYNLNYANVNEIKNMLNDLTGVGVYRNGFRIRPLGDAGYDWLKLDQKRVQNPSLKIGLNQIIGFIDIESEEKSNLEEKSARDGLKENSAYFKLVELFEAVILELENLRFKYRRQFAKFNRDNTSILVNSIFDYSNVKERVKKVLESTDKEISNQVMNLIENEEKEKNKTAEELIKKIAIYQGQATLGKIINVILHEGRRPLNCFSNEIPNLKYYSEKLKSSFSLSLLDKLCSTLDTFKVNTEFFTSLFKRIDPLASGNRGRKKDEFLFAILDNSVGVFKNLIESENIKINIVCDKKIKIHCWKQDLFTIFANIIDNSIYWLSKKENDRELNINVHVENSNLIFIDIIDNGPGIEEKDIESEIIFDPEYSTKAGGTGLGLALAGEACSRNNLKLEAVYCELGAHFRVKNCEVSDD